MKNKWRVAPPAGVLPKAGDRVGCVCGPSDMPRDDQGIVIAQLPPDNFHNHIVLILMDDGTTTTMVGPYTTVGIGVYLINRKSEVTHD